MGKERRVVGHRLDRLSMSGRMLQDLVACHDVALHFNEHDLAAKLDQCPAFMARVCGSKRLSTFWSETIFLPSSTCVRVWTMARSTRGSTSLAWVSRSLTYC